MKRTGRRCVSVLIALAVGAGCERPAASQVPEYQIRDSAGVTIVESPPSDVRLNWKVERLWTLGGVDDGPEAFFRVGKGALSSNGRGLLYVLDQGSHEIRVFSDRGEHLRTFGREGDGPGELHFPFAIAVSSDGSVSVVDLGKGALVRFDSTGSPLDQEPLAYPYLVDPAYSDGLLVGLLQHPPAPPDSTLRELVVVDAGTYTTLARLRGPPPVDADLGCAHVTGLPRIFEPEMHAVALSGSKRIAVSRSPAYVLEILDTPGRLLRRVDRAISPLPASTRLASEELGPGSRRFPGTGGTPCEVDADVVVEARGFAEVVPAARNLIATGDGGWWVERGAGASDTYVTVQHDDLDRVLLEAYRISR